MGRRIRKSKYFKKSKLKETKFNEFLFFAISELQTIAEKCKI